MDRRTFQEEGCWATPEHLRLPGDWLVSDMGCQPTGPFTRELLHSVHVHRGFAQAERELAERGYMIGGFHLDGEGVEVRHYERVFKAEEVRARNESARDRARRRLGGKGR